MCSIPYNNSNYISLLLPAETKCQFTPLHHLCAFIDSLTDWLITVSTVSHLWFLVFLFTLSKCRTSKKGPLTEVKNEKHSEPGTCLNVKPTPTPQMFYTSGTVALFKSLLLKVQASANMRQEMAATRLNG